MTNLEAFLYIICLLGFYDWLTMLYRFSVKAFRLIIKTFKKLQVRSS